MHQRGRAPGLLRNLDEGGGGQVHRHHDTPDAVDNGYQHGRRLHFRAQGVAAQSCPSGSLHAPQARDERGLPAASACKVNPWQKKPAK